MFEALERLGTNPVTVRGRRAIGVMVVAAAALALSGGAFLHAGARPDRLPPASSQVAASRPAPLQLPDSVSTSRSRPVTLSEAEAMARDAGLPLMKPGWLPFRSSPSNRPRQVHELRDSAGQLLSVITVYYGTDGQMLVVTQQFQAAQLSQADLEGTVGSKPALWSAGGGGLSLAWKTSGGRYLIIQGTGLTDVELDRVAASMA